MAGKFTTGEVKVRPGSYFNMKSNNGIELLGTPSGIVACAFKANFGPLNKVVELNSISDISDYFGDDSVANSNTNTLEKIFMGGASVIKAVRVGTGGTCAAITLKDTTTTDDTPIEVITLTQRYAGTRALSITIKDSLSLTTQRECIIYSGTKELLKVTFDKGTDEVNSLVDAINAVNEGIVTATKLANGNGVLAALNQTSFTTAGVSPTITSADYSTALSMLEAETFNVICVDTNEASVHALLKAFVERVNDAGLLCMGVVGEPTSVPLATRKADAAGFNSPSMVYVLNGQIIGGETIEGYNAAALIAGLIARVPSNQAITHMTLGGSDIVGPLTTTQIIECLQSGAIVFTKSSTGAIQIEQGINTLVSLSTDQDAGWKKIRRTKTRYELIDRVQRNTEPLIGNLTNDENGRTTILAIVVAIINDMVAEGKLISGTVEVDPSRAPSGDSAWFAISVYDLDSLEKLYFTYTFHYSDN